MFEAIRGSTKRKIISIHANVLGTDHRRHGNNCDLGWYSSDKDIFALMIALLNVASHDGATDANVKPQAFWADLIREFSSSVSSATVGQDLIIEDMKTVVASINQLCARSESKLRFRITEEETLTSNAMQFSIEDHARNLVKWSHLNAEQGSGASRVEFSGGSGGFNNRGRMFDRETARPFYSVELDFANSSDATEFIRLINRIKQLGMSRKNYDVVHGGWTPD